MLNRVWPRAQPQATPIEVSSAKPIASLEGMIVAAAKKVGKGQVYYFGTNLGASIAAFACMYAPIDPAYTGLRPGYQEGFWVGLGLADIRSNVGARRGSVSIPA